MTKYLTRLEMLKKQRQKATTNGSNSLMEPHLASEKRDFHSRINAKINGTSEGSEDKKSNLYVDFMLREWRWFLAILLAGGFIVLPASKTEINEVKSAVAVMKDTVSKLEDIVHSLPKTIGVLEASRADLVDRLDKLESKIDLDRQTLIHIEEKLSVFGPFSPYVAQSPPPLPATSGKSSKKKKLD
jgi:hypothetical protein